MTKTMTMEEFEALLDDFGPDLSSWPDDVQEKAAHFGATAEGKLLMTAAQELEDMFDASIAVGPETTVDGNSDAFLERLSDIPVYHQQQVQTTKSSGLTLWFKSLFASSTDWLSPTALASQAAVYVVVLGVGVFVGLGDDMSVAEYDEIDISETWFASSSSFDLEN